MEMVPFHVRRGEPSISPSLELSESGRMAPPTEEVAVTETRRDRPLDTLPRGAASRPVRKIGRMRMTRGMTVDSGAADNVIPRKMLRRRNRVRPSAASKAGVYYVAADNGRIPNEGEVDFPFQTKDGHFVLEMFRGVTGGMAHYHTT